MAGDCSADSIATRVVAVLSVVGGLSEAAIASKLVCVATDGASVMTGIHNGVTTQLQRWAPFLVPIHCMAHRTNLAAAALEQAPMVQEVVQLLRSLHKFFARSPKRSAHLQAAARRAGTKGLRMLKDVETR